MTDQEIRQIIEAGVDRSEIEYIMMHSEIGEDFQDQLTTMSILPMLLESRPLERMVFMASC